MEIITDICPDDKGKSMASSSEDVRNKLKDMYGTTIPSECNNFIERCLRVKDYDVEKATNLVRNFVKSNASLYDLLEKHEPKSYKDLFLNGIFTVLKSRDNFGRQIIVSQIGKWNPTTHDFDEASLAAMMLFSYTVGQSVETQRKGVVFIHDLTNFGLTHLRATKPVRAAQLLGLMQKCSPRKIKAVHAIFHPIVFGMLFQMVKPFIKQKLSKRLYFHGADVTSLHKHIRKEILPTGLGGVLCESECVDHSLIENLAAEEGLHKQLMTHGVPYQ